MKRTLKNIFQKEKYYRPEMENLLLENVKPNYHNEAAILEMNKLRNLFFEWDVLDLHYLQCYLAEKVLRARAAEIMSEL